VVGVGPPHNGHCKQRRCHEKRSVYGDDRRRLRVRAGRLPSRAEDQEKRDALDASVENSLNMMRSEDATFGRFLDDAYAYAVYPTVGKGGLIVGGAYGKGEVFDHGRMIGYSDLTQATVGGTIGGQAYTEVVASPRRPDSRTASRSSNTSRAG